jgi:hypothetical protein
MKSHKVIGYQGSDYFSEVEKEVIVCPNPKCRYKHVDEYGDTGIVGSGVFKNTKYIEYRCYKCETLLFKTLAHNPDGSLKDKPEPDIPFWLFKKMKVRTSRYS